MMTEGQHIAETSSAAPRLAWHDGSHPVYPLRLDFSGSQSQLTLAEGARLVMELGEAIAEAAVSADASGTIRTENERLRERVEFLEQGILAAHRSATLSDDDDRAAADEAWELVRRDVIEEVG